MARMISGALLMVWGVALVVALVTRDTDAGGAYGAGQVLGGGVFALLLVALGVRAFTKGRAARRAGA